MLIGCDVHDEHIGRFIFDRVEIVPPVKENEYLTSMEKIVKDNNIDLIIPTSEPELRFFSKNISLRTIGGAPLLMANTEAMQIGFDKLATVDFLMNKNLPYPWTITVGDGAPRELPCILKSRSGAGGMDVRLVTNPELVPLLQKMYPDYIWQENVASLEDEYTCGLYRAGNGEVRTLIIRRRLSSGVTSYGIVVESEEIDKLCRSLAISLNLLGSINIQLRLSSRGPVVFEINPRFSSTIMFRHKLGFEDLMWSIHQYRTGSVPKYETKPTAGTEIFRCYEELIIPT